MTENLHFDLRTLAVGCLYLLTNRATLHFPGSDVSKPSGKVVVDLTAKPLFRDGDRVYFPFFVYWGAWHEAVVPVLENKDVQSFVRDNPSLRVHSNFILLELGQYDVYIRKLEEYLKDSLCAAGYIPCETEEEPGIPETCPPAPTPVSYPSHPSGPDADAFYHPDGTPKLTYKVVDVG